MNNFKINHLLYIILLFSINTTSQNIIDGVTGATSDLIRIDSGFCYDSTAILHLFQQDAFDKHYVMYGTDTSKFDDSLLVLNWTVDYTQICTLRNLIPDKAYFFRYCGFLSLSPEKEYHYTNVGIMKTQMKFFDTQNPTVSLISPNDFDTIYTGEKTVIKWMANDNVAIEKVDVYYSHDNGISWEIIASSIENEDSLEYVFDFNPNDESKLKLVATDEVGLTGVDSSISSFTLSNGTFLTNQKLSNSNKRYFASIKKGKIVFTNALNFGDKIEILQLNGKVIYTTNIKNDNQRILPIDNLPSGIYLIHHTRNNMSILKTRISHINR